MRCVMWAVRAFVLMCVLVATVSAQEPAAATQEPAEPQKPRPTVIAIEVDGERRYTEQQLVDALGQRVGAPLDTDVVSRGLKTLWQAFHVRVDRVQVQEVSGGVKLRMSVDEMPVDLEPRFVGNAEVDTDTLRKWAVLTDKSELYLYQAARVRQRLLEGYHRDGYYFAEVQEVVREPGLGPNGETISPDVIFEIREGPQVRVKEVVLHGGDSMPETGMWFWKGGLKKLAGVELSGPWLFNWWGSKFVEDELQADLLAMRQVYRDRGYLDAVVEIDRLRFSADRGQVTVHVVIDEGVRYRVSSLSIAGVRRTWDAKARLWAEEPTELLFPEAELRAQLKLKVGGHYEIATQKQDEAALKRYYGERGYISHLSLAGRESWEFLEPELVFDTEKREVAVAYRMDQGRKRFIRDVLFQGGQHTRDRVLRREVGMLPGQQADLNEINKSLSRLYSTNYFLDEFTPQDHRDPTYRFIPTEDPDWVDLEYVVEEGRVVNFNIQGGVDSNTGLFGRLSLSMRNFDIANPPDSLWSTFGDIYDKEAFHGAGQRLDLELSPGTQINSYRIHFQEPDLFRSHFNPYSLDFDLLRRRRSDADFYTEEREDRRIRLGRSFGRELWVGVGYTNADLEIYDIEAPLTGINPPDSTTVPPQIFEQEGDSELIGLTFDLRYAQVDNTLNTRDGYLFNWRNAVYGGVVGGDYQFVKSEISFDRYLPVGFEESEVRPGFRFSLGLGIADGFGDSSETPYTERFFLGGRRTLRGFEYRGVGPNYFDEPLGGETSFNGTVEYRIPLYSVVQPGTYKRVEMFYATLFSDVGALDLDPYHLDPDELRASVGFGFGMVQPFPLILNFGFPVRSGDGDREEVFSFSIANIWF